MKHAIWLGLTLGGLLGGWIGSLIDSGDMFGLWSIVLGTLGSLVGIWAGFIIAQNY